MIKLFKRVRQRLISENKFSKYLLYAIGEIILVVIGILMALQINKWNITRVNKSLESQYCIRLLEDLKEDKAIMQATLNYSNEVKSHAKKAMLIFEHSESADKNPVENLIHLYQASQIQNPISAKSTYQELLSSGQINLIQLNELKTSIIRYYEYNWAESTTLTLKNTYRDNLRSKMPDVIQDEIRSKCGDIYIKIRQTYEVALPKECQINISIELAKSIINPLKNDVDLKKDLRLTIGNIEAKINFIESIKLQLEDLIIEIENAI
jgi:Family of unknown function (DUF6090)